MEQLYKNSHLLLQWFSTLSNLQATKKFPAQVRPLLRKPSVLK